MADPFSYSVTQPGWRLVYQHAGAHRRGVARIEKDPALCTHLEMETYTWEVLPAEMKNREVVDQLVGEYKWTMEQLQAHDLA